MSDPVRRALRSFLQSFSAILVASPAFQALASGNVDLPYLKRILIAAVGAGVTAVLSFGQNFLEDSSGKAFLIPKATPDPEPTAGAVVPQVAEKLAPEPLKGTEVPPAG